MGVKKSERGHESKKRQCKRDRELEYSQAKKRERGHGSREERVITWEQRIYIKEMGVTKRESKKERERE